MKTFLEPVPASQIISGLYALVLTLALFSRFCALREPRAGFLGKACTFKPPGQISIAHRVLVFLSVSFCNCAKLGDVVRMPWNDNSVG